MLVFAAVACGQPQTGETVYIDERLFGRIGSGDQAAFQELYERASGPVFSYALSLLRSPFDAEDAAQDTFLKIRSAAHLYQPQGKPLAWIFTITRNLCLMKFRQQAHISPTPLENLPEAADLSQIQDREDRMVLEAAFAVLTQEERQIVILHAVSGLKHREISQALGCPLSTVLSKYHRGLKKLRCRLEEMQ